MGAALSPFVLSACTSTGTGASLAMTETVDLALPDTVTVLPSSFARSKKDAGPVATNAALASGPDRPPIQPTAYAAASATKAAATGHGRVDLLIVKYASVYEVPVELVRRVVKRESNFLPGAYNRGHWGLMQIKHATARGMGYDGPARGLLDAETNLKYAVKYLRGAWLVADGDQDRAVRFYARGYYYDAKRQGLLDEAGLGTDRRHRLPSSI